VLLLPIKGRTSLSGELHPETDVLLIIFCLACAPATQSPMWPRGIVTVRAR